MLKPGHYEVLIYRSRSGKWPFTEWTDLLDATTRVRIYKRISRLRVGQFGDFKALDGGLYELRLFFGPGYRVYFGEHRGTIIVILSGGDKSTQSKDIKIARENWKNYLEDNL